MDWEKSVFIEIKEITQKLVYRLRYWDDIKNCTIWKYNKWEAQVKLPKIRSNYLKPRFLFFINCKKLKSIFWLMETVCFNSNIMSETEIWHENEIFLNFLVGNSFSFPKKIFSGLPGTYLPTFQVPW